MEILYTGFKGKNNSSYQLLSGISGQKLFLTNSFEGLKNDILGITNQYDMVIMFGLDKNLKDMLRIERVAQWEEETESTKLDCDRICRCLEESNLRCVVSEIPTKYLCNAAYYHMLQKVYGKAVFIHIPSLKNMSEHMVVKIIKSMEGVCGVK